MRDRELYATILGIEAPWAVVDVRLDAKAGEVEVHIERKKRGRLNCPACNTPCPGYDKRERRWRHLDTCQFQTILVAQVPRVECAEHGVLQVPVPWAEEGSQFTALFEALVIDWLKEASIAAVARLMDLSWDKVAGIMKRAVGRGLDRRGQVLPSRIGVDETSFQKRHEYVTVVNDLDEHRVVFVADDRKQSSLAEFYQRFEREQRAQVTVVAMDMWQPFIKATEKHIPDADGKIAFDRFHIAKHLNDAVDKVRRAENKAVRELGEDRLAGTRYLWLQKPKDIRGKRRDEFRPLRDSALRTARAWAIKETAASLWNYLTHEWARKGWRKWLGWALRCRLEPIVRAARMIRDHLQGMLNAIVHGVTNARAEGINAKIQWVKYTARGFRNRDRFRDAIYFHCGGLDMYPAQLKALS